MTSESDAARTYNDDDLNLLTNGIARRRAMSSAVAESYTSAIHLGYSIDIYTPA